MAHLQVTAGRTLLEGYIKTPPVGLSELIWNAFDEDASTVRIEINKGHLGGIDSIRITDDGGGMNRERADIAFSRIGDSWKNVPGKTSEGGRPVHGRHGRGRYAAFSLGSVVHWTSTAVGVDAATLGTIKVKGSRANLNTFEVEDVQPSGHPGTSVEIFSPTPEAVKAFDSTDSLRNHLLSEFALRLDRHPDFTIYFLGTPLDPASAIANKTVINIDLPNDIQGNAKLTVIEWKLSGVERRLYLCDAGGTVIDERPPGIHAVGAEFTAYLQWDGFTATQDLILEGDEETPAGKVLDAGRLALRSHLAQSSRQREVDTVNRWKAEGVYPYESDPSSAVERATRDTFNIVAMAASRTVDEAKSRSSKAMALSLLKETFENDPEALLPILRKFAQLPTSRIDELQDILERTTLSHLITLGRDIGDRVDFLNGLNALLFDRATKKRMLERRQLHRILAHETWLFGEEWSLTGDDERLTEVLKKFLVKLGLDVELADQKPVLREDGSDAIPDLVLGRQLETRENFFSHLVVELKRPNHRISDDDVSQIRSYASAITNDERFDQTNASWEFWLIGNETTREVDEFRNQEGLPFGLVQNSKKYQIFVRTWAEVLGDAAHRLKFVQRSLQFESTRDTGLAFMREKFSAYLPESARGITEEALDNAGPQGHGEVDDSRSTDVA
ncbi:ATP-binding protein [Brachybacterium sp. UNK5269]|uniref:ATP-binding protein n=1 Tax=Brachybacterium sp. UNK5269 TaxID=3408576 RepID=UPI003BB144D1